MATIDRSVGQVIFGNDPTGYAEGRPEYPARVYEVLRTTCQLGPATNAFDVGAGTGQATFHLLEHGYQVTAIEPDTRLAAVLREKVTEDGLKRLSVCATSFETAELLDASFDLGVAATSFHWLDAPPTLRKIMSLLRPGGWWAMWWTVFGDPKQPDEFRHRTEIFFEDLERSPSHGNRPNVPFALDTETRMRELREAGFESISYESIQWTARMTTKQVLALTATFSPVACLPETQRERFMNELGRVVDEEFGGIVARNFVTPIYTALRP
jgi:SAM-dependent methyltransferase